MRRKGIILAGGKGSRLAPLTTSISKQLLPVYDKPLIYYPLSTLMLAEIKEILVITTQSDKKLIQNLLGDGSNFGLKIEYAVQYSPDGIAQGLIIAEEFLAGSNSVIILGDNLFYGNDLKNKLLSACKREKGATIFGYRVNDPQRYGIVKFNAEGKVVDLVEKPKVKISDYAITGIYFYDNRASKFARKLTPSSRGELEITELNKLYLKDNSLHLEKMGRGYAWLDTGTNDSLLEASQFVHSIEKRQGLKISCPEEIAFNKGWITRNQLKIIIKRIGDNEYSNYLAKLINLDEN